MSEFLFLLRIINRDLLLVMLFCFRRYIQYKCKTLKMSSPPYYPSGEKAELAG